MIKTPIAALVLAGSVAFGALMSPTPAVAQIDLTVMIAPPPLPVYEQPPIPGPGYLWAPGYWSYGPYGYYWVPGTWVEPPTVGLLWQNAKAHAQGQAQMEHQHLQQTQFMQQRQASEAQAIRAPAPHASPRGVSPRGLNNAVPRYLEWQCPWRFATLAVGPRLVATLVDG
jgi:WXXGXW repeat (2 copies)